MKKHHHDYDVHHIDHHTEIVAKAVTPGQIKTIFSCRAGDDTPKTSQLSHLVKDEFKRQLDVYGYVKHFDNK